VVLVFFFYWWSLGICKTNLDFESMFFIIGKGCHVGLLFFISVTTIPLIFFFCFFIFFLFFFFFLLCLSSYLCLGMGSVFFFFRLLGKKWQIRYEVVRFGCLCNKAEFMMRSMFLQGQHKWSLQFCVSLGFWSIYTRCCMFENLCFVYLEWFTNIYFNFLHCLRFHFWKVIMAIVIPFTHASIQVILCFHFCVVFFV
jgi:hypothetical protein